MPLEGHAVTRKTALGRRIHVVSDLLPARRPRRSLELAFPARLADHIFKNKLRHYAAADIAVADKEYFHHQIVSFIKTTFVGAKVTITLS